MDLSKRVRTRRRALELSQEALARRADVSMSLINQLERGLVSDPHYSTLAGLADALGMSISELIGEEQVEEGKALAPLSGA
jgi:transcriptional regulator with XRE-family HTH domain